MNADGGFHSPIPGREGKPRRAGITMVIDKGLGVRGAMDFMETCAEYVDFVKLGFGTPILYREEVVREKVRCYRSYGLEVYPGGTLLEVALWQGRLAECLDLAGALGFTYIEVSDGTIELDARERARAIKQAISRGFKVVTEVGKKDAEARVRPERVLKQIYLDLELGAEYVIMEGRESGQGVGIYDSRGVVMEKEFIAIAEGIPDPSAVIWEAPLKKQQENFIVEFGPNVNLGNVKPEEVLALEALRLGLRSDTFKAQIEGSISRWEKRAGISSSGSQKDQDYARQDQRYLGEG